MKCCECLGLCVGGTLYCVGAAVYYPCKYIYIGISWCVKKIYNYYTSSGTAGVPPPSNRDYVPVNSINVVRSATQRTNYPDTSRVVSHHASTSNNPGRVHVPSNSNNIRNINTTSTTNNYVKRNDNTSNGTVNAHASNFNSVPINNNKVKPSKVQSRGNDAASDSKRTRHTAHSEIAPLHGDNQAPRGKNNSRGSGTTYCVANEIYGRNGPSGGNWRNRDKSNSRDEKKGQHEFRIPTSAVRMPSGRTVSVTNPARFPCHCKQLGATKLIPLWPKSKMGSLEYQIVSYEMDSTISQHYSGSYSRYQIVSVHKLKNCCIWTKFRNRQIEIGKENDSIVNQRMLFHGSAAVDDIVRMGFDERHSNINGMFGAGIYFAEHSSKSNQYVFGYMGGNGCAYHSNANCSLCDRKMLLCRVTLGKTDKMTSASKMAHAPPGFHSVAGVPTSSGLRYPEYVIYRGEQAYPEYLITYKIIP